MKNYSRKTNRSVTRYRTPAMFRLRAVIDTRNAKLSGRPPGPPAPKFGRPDRPDAPLPPPGP